MSASHSSFLLLFLSFLAATPLLAQESPLAKPLRKYDTNKDGKLIGEELVQARQAFNRGGKDLETDAKFFKQISERRKRNWREQQLKVLDLNGNGTLEAEEEKRAEAIWAEINLASDKLRADLLRKYDKNDDGQLDQAERDASRPEFDAKRKEIETKAMAAQAKP